MNIYYALILLIVTSQNLIEALRDASSYEFIQKPIVVEPKEEHDPKITLLESLFSKKNAQKPEEALDILKRLVQIESRGVEKTNFIEDLRNVGDVDDSKCRQLDFFPQLRWLIIEFKNAPNVKNYLDHFYQEYVTICSDNFLTDTMITLAEVPESIKKITNELREAVSKQGVFVMDDREPSDDKLVAAIAQYLVDKVKKADERMDLAEARNAFRAKYAALIHSCKMFYTKMGPSYQVYHELGDKLGPQSELFKKLQSMTSICNKIHRNEELAPKIGRLMVVSLTKFTIPEYEPDFTRFDFVNDEDQNEYELVDASVNMPDYFSKIENDIEKMRQAEVLEEKLNLEKEPVLTKVPLASGVTAKPKQSKSWFGRKIFKQ